MEGKQGIGPLAPQAPDPLLVPPLAQEEEGWIRTGLLVASVVISVLQFITPAATVAGFVFRGITYLLTPLLAGLDLRDVWNGYWGDLPNGEGDLALKERLSIYSLIANVTSIAWGILGLVSLVSASVALSWIMLGLSLISMTFAVMVFLEKRGVFAFERAAPAIP